MRYLVFLGMCMLLLACSPAEKHPWFEDRTDQAGVSFVHQSGAVGNFYLPEIMGGGIAIADFNNDNHMDLYFIQSGSLDTQQSPKSNELYLNRGDGTFILQEKSGSEDTGYGIGVATGDYDNDADVDIYVTNV
ncbi:MAG: VCBS repeat-containing protein, partial [Gammaproteobacteria bacterium]|nr:VCBS repeat-containing protein [Gammaproteobacteria bacterium]